MKKKEYINPEMQVVKIQHHGQLLVDSVVQSILSEDFSYSSVTITKYNLLNSIFISF